MPKKCKICSTAFSPEFTSFQKTCNSMGCIILFGKQEASRLTKRSVRQEKKKAREKDRSYWIKRVQTEFNKYIRNRDHRDPCISCKRHHTGQYHAGHYMSVGGHSAALRFDEQNTHKQCSVCNNHKSGNLVEYRPNLIDKIGLDEVERLEGPHDPKKYSIDELQDLLSIYQAKNKEWAKSQS
jgi:hypothetical protein